MRRDKETSRRLFQRKGLETRSFPKKTSGKAVDFILFFENSIWGYAEVKTIVEYTLFGERRDPTYNKIQNKIHEASKQFASCNPRHEYPNIVVFVNQSKKLGFQDLWLVLSGQFAPPSQHLEIVDLRYFGRLAQKHDLDAIDYFIWIDHPMKRVCYAMNSDSSFEQALIFKISSQACEDWDDL